MDRLWAPWRIKYIRAKRPEKCIFCSCLKKKGKNYVVFKTEHSFCVLNIYPYNNGHVMIVPKRHIQKFSQLNQKEVLDIFHSMEKAQTILDKVLKPQGYNIGVNLSRIAGAGETRHLHIHIVPRWKGDVNFMTTLFGTKVISQSLDELHKRLKSESKKSDA